MLVTSSNPYLSDRAMWHIFQVIAYEIASGNDHIAMIDIAIKSRYSARTVAYAINELERSRKLIIHRQPPGHPSHYQLPREIAR
jgi:hypothetical protein